MSILESKRDGCALALDRTSHARKAECGQRFVWDAAVACWKSSCWPVGSGNVTLNWNGDTEMFEPVPAESTFSTLEWWVKSMVWSIWYNVFPVVYTILFLCTLCGIMDEGKFASATRLA